MAAGDDLIKSSASEAASRAFDSRALNVNGVLDMKEMLQGYKDMAEALVPLFKEAHDVGKLAKDAAQDIAKEVDATLNKAQDIKTKTSAHRSSYQAARENAKTQGEVNRIDALARKQAQQDAADRNKEFQESMQANLSGMTRQLFTGHFKEAVGSFKEAAKSLTSKDGLVSGLDSAIQGLANFTSQLKGTIKTIGEYKTAWDTRLWGSDKDHTSVSDTIKNAVGASPFVKQADVMSKLNSAIDKGISYNVEQRAFLDVLSESVATTFEAFNDSINSIIRVQQADSTAYRLGMEASLNEYLNSMFESTEYLSNVSDSVTANLMQATSLLDAEKSIAMEYQIQKWLGSLYSVGMSSGAISNISSVLGQALSGNINAVDSDTGKLLVMAAASAGMDFASMLTDGLDSSELNTLMQSMVSYLQTIASDNKVVQSQMASIYGLQTSDIQAAKNLAGSLGDIYSAGKGYSAGSALSELKSMTGSIMQRMSMAGILSNITDNLKYTLAEGIAANPALYSIMTIGDMLDAVGGISIPTISFMGTSVDLEATVADILKATALGGSFMAGIGSIFSGLGSLGQGGPLSALDKLMASSNATVKRGGGWATTGGEGTSLTALNYKGNAAGDDYINATTAMTEDQKTDLAVKAEDDNQKDINDIYDNQTRIIEILEALVNHESTIRVESYYSSGTGVPENYLYNTR